MLVLQRGLRLRFWLAAVCLQVHFAGTKNLYAMSCNGLKRLCIPEKDRPGVIINERIAKSNHKIYNIRRPVIWLYYISQFA